MHKILIIEDEVDTAKVLAKRLSVSNFEVAVASDAYQGTELAHKAKPDLIILDLMLPAGGGLRVLENIDKSSETVAIPVIVLTAMKDEEYKRRILDKKIEAFLEKPYDFAELIKTINQVLTKTNQA